MASSSSISLSLSQSPPHVILSSFKPKTCHFLNAHSLFLPNTHLSGKALYFYNPSHKIIPRKRTKFWRNNATTSGEVLSSESTPLENSQQMVSPTGDDGSSAIISVLFFAAFLALSILTIGVIYIGVTDFLQKREREKFEKEEAAKKKKVVGKKVKARTRAGPRGFGQKIDDDEDDD